MIQDFDVDPSLVLILVLLAVVSASLSIWGIVRLFRGGHVVVGVLSLFVPVLAVLGFLLAPTPHSALYRKRQRRTQVGSASLNRIQVRNSHAAHQATADLTIGTEDPTTEIPVLAETRYQLPDDLGITMPPGQRERSGRRSSATTVLVVTAITAVGLHVAHLVILNQYRSSVLEIMASVAELSARAGTANDAWDTGEAPLPTGSSERDSLFGEAEKTLEGILAETMATSRHASVILRPISVSRERHDQFVAAVLELNEHAEGMLVGLRIRGRFNKEDRLSSLAAYQDAASSVLGMGKAIAPP